MEKAEAGELTKHMFDVAWDEVFKMVENDVFRRYLKSASMYGRMFTDESYVEEYMYLWYRQFPMEPAVVVALESFDAMEELWDHVKMSGVTMDIKKDKNCVSGKGLVSFLLENKYALNEVGAIAIGQRLCTSYIITPLTPGIVEFKNKLECVYKETSPESTELKGLIQSNSKEGERAHAPEANDRRIEASMSPAAHGAELELRSTFAPSESPTTSARDAGGEPEAEAQNETALEEKNNKKWLKQRSSLANVLHCSSDGETYALDGYVLIRGVKYCRFYTLLDVASKKLFFFRSHRNSHSSHFITLENVRISIESTWLSRDGDSKVTYAKLEWPEQTLPTLVLRFEEVLPMQHYHAQNARLGDWIAAFESMGIQLDDTTQKRPSQQGKGFEFVQ